MRRMASAVAQTRVWAAACTMRRGNRQRPAAPNTALGSAHATSFPSLSGAAAVTTPSTCGYGRSASTRCRPSCALMRAQAVNATVRSLMAGGMTTLVLRSVLSRRSFNTFISIRQARQVLQLIAQTCSLAIRIRRARSSACARFLPPLLRSAWRQRVTTFWTTGATIGQLNTPSAAARTR